MKADETKLKPLHNFVILRAETPDEFTAGGLMLPPAARQRATSMGRVIAVGPGGRDDHGRPFVMPPDLKPGVRVLFARYHGDLWPDDRNVRVLPYWAIKAIVEEDVDIETEID